MMMTQKFNYILLFFLSFTFSSFNKLEVIEVDSTVYILENKLLDYKKILHQAELDLRGFLIFHPTDDLMNSPDILLEFLKRQNKVTQISQIYNTIQKQLEDCRLENINLHHQTLIEEKKYISQESMSISDMEELAQMYSSAEFYEDALNVYQQIIYKTINIFGKHYFELGRLYNEISNIYLLQSDLKMSKSYFQKAINIQKTIILREQNNYLKPLNGLRDIYKIEKNISKFAEVDSLIKILNNNTDTIYNDSLIVFPNIYINNQKSNNMISEYSIDELANDLINEGQVYLQNNLFTEASLNFIEAYNANSKLLNVNYLSNLAFRDSIEIINIINSMENIILDDSLQYTAYLYSGLLYQKIGNNDSAIINLDNYLKFNNDPDINVLHLKGTVYLNNLDYKNAIFTFFRAHLIDPNNFYSNLYLGNSLIKFGEYIDGRDYIIFALMQNPHNVDANFALALSSYYLTNFEDAIIEFQNTLLLDSENQDIFYYLAKSYEANKQYKQSMDALKKCIELDFDFPLAHFELGKIYELIFDENNAIKEYEIANKYIENFDININELNYRIGFLYYKNGHHKEALLPFREYVINNLEDYASMDILGEILIEERRFPESIEIYLQLLEIYPDNYDFYNKLSQSYYSMKDYSNALFYFKKMLDYNEEDQLTLLNIGTIYNQMSQFEKAEKYLTQAINCGNISKEILSQLGIAYGGQGAYMQALQTFKEALSLSLHDPILNYQIGYIYMQLNIYDLALKSLAIYIETYPEDYLGYYLMGKNQLELGLYDQAVLSLEASYKRNNLHLESLYDLGNCYLLMSDFKQSAQYYKRVIRQNPDHVLSRIKLIDVYLGLNKSREAKKECNIIYMLNRDLYHNITYCSN